MIVFPIGNTANYRMVYGAPLVLSAEITPDTVAKGVVFDYQGFDNIDSVFVSSLHEPTDGTSTRIFWHEQPMRLLRQIDQYSGEFIIELPEDLGRIIINRLRFRVKDHDNFEALTIIIF